MGLFSSDFEKTLYQNLFDTPFSGYDTTRGAVLSDLAFAFCASLAHNAKVFPSGIGKRIREQAFYGGYALACQLTSMFALPGKSEQTAHEVTTGFSKAALKSGVPDSLVAERLGLIKKYIDVASRSVEDHGGDDDASREAVFRAAYLSIIGAAVCRQTLDGIGEEIDRFGEAFEAFLESHREDPEEDQKPGWQKALEARSS